MPNVLNCCSDPDCWGCGGSGTNPSPPLCPPPVQLGFTVSEEGRYRYPELTLRWSAPAAAAAPGFRFFRVYFDDKLAGTPRTTSVRFTVASKDHLPELVKVTAVYDWGESVAADFTVRSALTGRPAITGVATPQGPGLEKLPPYGTHLPPKAKDPCPRHYTGDPELPCRCAR